MTRIELILKAARYSLADPDKERYTDERLLFALSEAQKDIARQTRLLKAEVDIPLIAGEFKYAVPSDLWLITRATFNQDKVPLMSYDRMDAHDPGWAIRYGSKVEAVVYDNRNMHEIRVYPRPNDDYIEAVYQFIADNPTPADSSGLTPDQIASVQALITLLGTLNTLPLDMTTIYLTAQAIIDVVPQPEGLQQLGVVTGIDGVDAQPLVGVLTNIGLDTDYNSWPGAVIFDSPYGVATSITETTGVLHLYYIKDPEPVVNVTDELLVSKIFDTALRHYIVGAVYGDDLDTQYQARSAASFNMYDRELKTVGTPTDLTDGTRAAQYTGVYTTPFN